MHLGSINSIATSSSHHSSSKPSLTMARAVLIRSITSYTSHSSNRYRLIPNFYRRYPIRHHLRRHISTARPSPIQLRSPLSHISPRSIATSPQFSSDAIGAHDEAAEKLGFEKVSELNLKQETPDPPKTLKSVPTLSLHDIPKKPTQIPIEVGDINGVKVLHHEFSETITYDGPTLYCDIVFDMSSLKHELLPLVPLFCQSLLEMGTEDLLEELIRIKTRGLSIFPFTSSKHGSDTPVSHIVIRGKALSAQHYTEHLFDLVNWVLQDVEFADQELFKQFVSQSKAIMENRLRNSGHDIAAARMDAKLNSAGWIREQMGGVSYLEFLKDLEEKVEHDWSSISASLEEIRKTVLSKNNCIVNLTSDGENLKDSEKYVAEFIDSLPTTSPVASSASWNNKRISSINEAIVIPTQVNYVGKAANLYETGYQRKGSAYVICNHISNTWLRDRVRVNGGAYNGFCDFNPYSGIFSFLSYRDPNLLKTLDIYDGTVDFLRQMEMDDDILTKAIFETIGDVDSYQQSPEFKGYSSLLQYLLGITEEERQIRHEEILSTRLSDFQAFANALDATIKDKGVVVAVASPDDVDAANKERPNFFQLKKAL
ncbi:presequence protease 1, chloroplastic/mitochondrial-like [Rutidosis leptorrhynchoides]|uniref:presequence protease 1, chloroplastic/mitochondrial-like n=1 Tax=Rutidosis leptorrhynchoides TaxID=125765 RepID=UPI003A98EC74